MHETTKKNLSLGIAVTSLLISAITYGVFTKDRANTLAVVAQEPVVTATPVPTIAPVPDDIYGYIFYKFGDDAWKALAVLNCENKSFNPEAKNDNTLWGGVGVDRGYWQINNVFHPYVSGACAKDVECSTDYAYRMYKNDGNSFVRWTCGKQLGL
jgi:hypothetical protein